MKVKTLLDKASHSNPEIKKLEQNKFDKEIYFANLMQGSRFTVKDKYGNGFDSYTYSVTKSGEDFFVSELWVRHEAKKGDETSVNIAEFSIRKRKSPKSKSIEVWKKKMSPYEGQSYETFKNPSEKGRDLSSKEVEDFWEKYNDPDSIFEAQATEEVLEHHKNEIWKYYAKMKQQRHYEFIVETNLPKTEDLSDPNFTPYTEVIRELER